MNYNRLFFIEKLLKQRGYKTYLEIGVFLGKVFFFVSAPRKIAVDPDFKFGLYRKIKRVVKKFSNLFAKFYSKTSDAFFTEDAARLFEKKKIDICLVDGMHEYDFALRDVENSLKYLQQNGVIFMHDCNPKTPEAAVLFREWKDRGFTGDWNGDVWKSILHLRSMRDDVNVFVLDCDFGLGVVTWGKPETKLSFTPQQISALTYEDLNQNRKEWLNLKEPGYFFEYFNIARS
jgi:hypothetical protein